MKTSCSLLITETISEPRVLVAIVADDIRLCGCVRAGEEEREVQVERECDASAAAVRGLAADQTEPNSLAAVQNATWPQALPATNYSSIHRVNCRPQPQQYSFCLPGRPEAHK